MPVPKTLNARIALAKGWQPVQIPTSFSLSPSRHTIEKWQPPNPHASLVDKEDLPDHVGTLQGVAELMRELNEAASKEVCDENPYPRLWQWLYCPAVSTWEEGWPDAYQVFRKDLWGTIEHFESSPDRPGDCVAAAWLSVFGKESDE